MNNEIIENDNINNEIIENDNIEEPFGITEEEMEELEEE